MNKTLILLFAGAFLLITLTIYLTLSGSATLANPASTFCLEEGGLLDFRNGTGHCMFQNGVECEEWAFYRGECTQAGTANPASVFCIDRGGTLQLRNNTGYCIFSNGNECEEWAYFRGECTP